MTPVQWMRLGMVVAMACLAWIDGAESLCSSVEAV